MPRRSLTGPGGITLILDSSEIFPDDPGNGTPAMVDLGDYSASFQVATQEQELMDSRGHCQSITQAQAKWLDLQSDTVDSFLSLHGG